MGNDPTRTCVGCRARRPSSSMLRAHWGGQAGLGFDAPGPYRRGRGAWFCIDPRCAVRGVVRGGLGRALRAPSFHADERTVLETMRWALLARLASAVRAACRAGEVTEKGCIGTPGPLQVPVPNATIEGVRGTPPGANEMVVEMATRLVADSSVAGRWMDTIRRRLEELRAFEELVGRMAGETAERHTRRRSRRRESSKHS